MARAIPEDLLSEILIRLPVKSLLKFRCVCKSWNSLISNPNLITAQINHNYANNSCNTLVRCFYDDYCEDTYALHSDYHETLIKIMEIDFPFRNGYISLHVLDCVNGLVCLIDMYPGTHTVILWNPMIRKCLTLPNPNYEISIQEFVKMAVGFGFDAVSNDYKVVMIYNLDSNRIVEVFKLRTSRWTVVENGCSLASVRPGDAKYLNGVLHWLAYDQSIVGFDLITETFTEMMLPSDLESRDISIVAWRELISIFEIENRESSCLWVMKEYGVEDSWTKLIVIGGFGPLYGVRRNGELLFIDDYCTNVSSYNPETRDIKHHVIELEGHLDQLQISSYVESLVLLNEGEGLPAQPMDEVEREDHIDDQ